MTHKAKDLNGREWTINRLPCGWVAYIGRAMVLDPYDTLRETKAAIRDLKPALEMYKED